MAYSRRILESELNHSDEVCLKFEASPFILFIKRDRI